MQMKEVKQTKKPLIFYYGIVLLVLLLFNIAGAAAAGAADSQGGRLRHIHENDLERGYRSGADILK
jgi:hypothetical protein